MLELKSLNNWKKKTYTYENSYYEVFDDIGYENQQDGYTFRLVHLEEKYGLDTWGWSAYISTEFGSDTMVAYKCLSKEEAYRQLHLYVKEYNLQPMTKGSRRMYSELLQKYKEVKAAYNKLNQILVKDSRTSEFIGCAVCGSKLARQYLRKNFCPVCNGDLRSNTTQERLKKYQEKLSAIVQQIRQYDPSFYAY